MKEGWEYKKFETCINKVPKAKQVKTNDYNTGTKYPIVSQEDKLISGYYDDESMVYHIDSPVIIFGDHTRVLKYVDFDFVVGADGVKIISPKKELNAKFLLYYLTWYKIPNLGYSRHYKLLKDLDIPIPPKSTQLAIVLELDKINELIRLKKEQLVEYDNLAQSIFYEMFGDPVENEKGWEVKKLGDICVFSQGIQIDVSKQKNDFQEGYNRFLRIVDYTTFNTDIRYVPVTDKKYWINLDDIVVVRYGASAGFVGIMKEGILANNLFKISYPRDRLEMLYLFHYLQSGYYKSFIQKIAFGAAMPALSFSSFGKLEVMIPPLPLQQSFASRIEQIEKLKSEVQNAITDLETLLASRMQYWFE